DQLVRTRRSIVPGVDARPDPEVLLPADLGLDQVGGPAEADRATARERAARVEEVELPLHSRDAHGRGPAELRPLAAVPIFEVQRQVRAALRRGHDGWLEELGREPAAPLRRGEQRLVAQLQR